MHLVKVIYYDLCGCYLVGFCLFIINLGGQV